METEAEKIETASPVETTKSKTKEIIAREDTMLAKASFLYDKERAAIEKETAKKKHELNLALSRKTSPITDSVKAQREEITLQRQKDLRNLAAEYDMRLREAKGFLKAGEAAIEKLTEEKREAVRQLQIDGMAPIELWWQEEISALEKSCREGFEAAKSRANAVVEPILAARKAREIESVKSTKIASGTEVSKETAAEIAAQIETPDPQPELTPAA